MPHKTLAKSVINARPIWLTFLVCPFMLALVQNSEAKEQKIAQTASEQSQAAAAPAQAEKDQEEKFSQEELEQLVAPIALHPDSLLSQILMASTYPLDVVNAARWVEKNPKVAGKALENAMEKQPWDSSVKSLTAFPQVLDMMNSDLAWTQTLGDAFLSQSEDVLATVQLLRARAAEAGNLDSTEQQTVTKEVVTMQSTGAQETVYVIEPANPQTVYVPAYNPAVVYGTWPYPAPPPYSYYPPGWVPGIGLAFGVGLAVGHHLWGHCNWGRGNVNINVDRWRNVNRGDRNVNRGDGGWRHNPNRRGSVPYRGDARQKFGDRGRRDSKARENFRGRSDRARQGAGQGRRKQARKQPRRTKKAGAKRRSSSGKKQARRTGGQKKAQRRSTGNRKKTARRPSAGQRRPQSRTRNSQRRSAYQGAGRGRGNQARRQSSRGRMSRGGGRGGGRRGGGRRR